MAAEGVASLYSDRRSSPSSGSPPSRGGFRRSCACMRLTAEAVRGAGVRTSSSSSTARASPCASPAWCAPPIPRFRSSTMSRPRSGPGGRGARAACARYIDHILALLPFEPEVHRRLGGPPCTYVGHPLAEEVRESASRTSERRAGGSPRRRSCWCCPEAGCGEIKRLLGVFADTVALVGDRVGPLEVVVPTVPHLVEPIADGDRATGPYGRGSWSDAADKQAAFRIARAALAKSGTVTLELALAGVPTVAAYRVSWLEACGRTAHDQGPVGDPRQSGARRERGAGIHPGSLHRGKPRRRPGPAPRRYPAAAAPARGVFPARRHHGNRARAHLRRVRPTSCSTPPPPAPITPPRAD